MDAPSAKRRVVHLHIPKTAGTALRAALEQIQKDKSRIFPYYDERKFVGVDPDRYDLFSGHIGFKTASGLGGDLFCILRHPVDRFVSVYYFWRQLHSKNVENTINTRLAAKFSLDDFADIRDVPSLIEEFQDRMTLQIAHGSALAQRLELLEAGLTRQEIFNLAIENTKKFAALGVQEDLSVFEAKIKAILGIGLNVRRLNVTESRSAINDLPARTVRKIEDWAPWDLLLYEYVRNAELREAVSTEQG